MTCRSIPPLLTTGQMARELGVPRHRILYVIQTRGIEPAGKAGVAFVYTEHEFDVIAAELRRIDADAARKW